MNKKLIPAAIAATLMLVACGDSADTTESATDDDRACRIAQRLVDDLAEGDIEGAERQIERLEDLDGIADRTNVDDVIDLTTSGDEDAALDIADQLDDDLDCEVDVPEVTNVVEAAPVETQPAPTDPAPTDPPATDPPATDPPATDPPATDPPATDPPTTDADAAPPVAEGAALAVVDIAATGPGIDRPDLAQDPADVLAESGISVLPIPAGAATAIEYSISYDLDTFADEPAYSAFEEFTFVAATDMSIDDVRVAFVAAIEGAYEMEFSTTDSTATRDEVTQTATALSPDRSRQGVPRYDVIVATSTESPGVVVIEVKAGDYRLGALPAFTDAAAAVMGGANGIGADFGWTIDNWSWSPGFNQFSGSASARGRIDFSAGSGVEADVAPLAEMLLERVPTPTFEDIEDDRHFYIVSDDEDWSVRYSDVYEDNEMRVSYSYSI